MLSSGKTTYKMAGPSRSRLLRVVFYSAWQVSRVPPCARQLPLAQITRACQSTSKTATQGFGSLATRQSPRIGSACRIGSCRKAFEPGGAVAHAESSSASRITQGLSHPFQCGPLQAELLDEEALPLSALDVLARHPPLKDGDREPGKDSGQRLNAHPITDCQRP